MRIADSTPIMLAKEKRSSHAKVALQLAPQLTDKGYCSSKGTFFYGVKLHAVAQRLAKKQNLDVRTPVKKKKGQKHLSAANRLFSTAVSKVRQSIESLFNWIHEKTGIQRASKVRSYRRLLVHAFGRFAAAMLLLSLSS